MLPYEILIPNTLFEEELLKFTEAQKRALLRGGLKVIDLPGERVLRAQQVVRAAPQLSVHDGFALALAETHTGCILLTGDGYLRELAESHKIKRGTSAAGFGYSSPWSAATVSHGNLPRLELP